MKRRKHQTLSALPPEKAFHTPVSLWFAHILKHKSIYFIGLLSVAGTNIAEVGIPYIFKEIIESLEKILSFPSQLFVILLATLALQFVCRILWRRFMAQQTHVVSAGMKSRVWASARYFKRSRLQTDLNPGELMNVAAGDVGTARFIFGFTLVAIVDFVFLLTFTLIAMFSIDASLTALCCILIPILPYFLNKLARAEGEAHMKSQEQLSKMSAKVTQTCNTIRLQRLSQSQGFWTQKLGELASEYRDRRWKVLKLDLAFRPLVGISPIVSYTILILLGISKVFDGSMSIGEFVAFQSYVFLLESPLSELGFIVSETQRAFTSLGRYTNTVKQPHSSMFKGQENIPPMEELLFSVKDLSFSHADSSNFLISNLSFDLRRGELLGIRGPIGSGKSTLLDLLSGFQRKFEGRIELLGNDIRNYSHIELRKLVAIVPQKPFLFATTLRSNLSLDKILSDKEVEHHLSMVGLLEDVATFPHAYDTMLGEWGVNLSGGQKQRLTLARALASDSEIYLFDDCLSAVDTNTEKTILNNIRKHFSEKTFVLVAHRQSTLDYCDRVLELGS